MNTKIKICGLYRPEDIEAVNQYKPDYAGFILNYKKSHRYVDLGTFIQLSSKLDKEIPKVGVFLDAPSTAVLRLLDENRIQIAQLHGSESDDYIREIQKAGKEVWKVYLIKSEDDLKRAAESPADRILLDAGLGQGKTFDWELLNDFPREYILAGGLSQENIEPAIRNLHPYALDLSSGVETEKKKDPEKIRKVIEMVRSFDYTEE